MQYQEGLKQSGGSVRLNQIIEHLFESPAINIPFLAKICDVSYPTARSNIERLVNVGILKQSGISERPKIYFAPHILEIVFGD